MKSRENWHRRSFYTKHHKTLWGYFFIAPAILSIIIFFLGPMVYSLAISFTQWDILQSAKWVMFDNYIRLAGNALAMHSLGVTLYYTALAVPAIIISMFFLALLLNVKVRGIGVFRTVFYLPAIVPAVAGSALWMFIFQPQFGLLNSLLGFVGIPSQNWIYGETTVIPSMALVAAWGAGNTMVVYLAGLQGLPVELYESMQIDGGNSYHKLRYITVPMMSPIIFYNLIMAMISSMQTFTQSFIMTGGGPNNASLFYVLHMYRVAFVNQEMGYASAMSWLLSVIVAGMTIAAFKLSNMWVFYESGGKDDK